MLKISATQAAALETQVLARWKAEIGATLRQRFPGKTRQIAEPALQSWTREAMQTARQIGAASKADLQDFALTLFMVSEARRDPAAGGDFAAIMGSENDFAAKIAMMRKAFAP